MTKVGKQKEVKNNERKKTKEGKNKRGSDKTWRLLYRGGTAAKCSCTGVRSKCQTTFAFAAENFRYDEFDEQKVRIYVRFGTCSPAGRK